MCLHKRTEVKDMQLSEAFKVVAIHKDGSLSPLKFDATPIIKGEKYQAKNEANGIHAFINREDADSLCKFISKDEMEFARLFTSMTQSKSNPIKKFKVVKVIPFNITHKGFGGTDSKKLYDGCNSVNAIECREIIMVE